MAEDPTSRGDRQAEELREWYEANRETWWQRYRRRTRYWQNPDSFMYRMIEAVERITQEPTNAG